MFNPLTPSEMVAAIGLAARGAARGDDGLDEFDRGQLMSAYSGSRHLAIEISSFADELAARCAAIANAVEQARGASAVAGADPLRGLATRLRSATDARSAGDAIAELLELCRGDRPDPALETLRGQVHGELRALCDAEVELLADGIEAGRS